MKLAVINGNEDILRIIPTAKKDRIDFKFALRDNNFILNYWELGLSEPISFTTNSEITYHSSDGDKKPVIHVKERDEYGVHYKHKFHDVVDIYPNSYFPIPLCKISMGGKFSNNYKRKNDHSIFNFSDKKLNDINCVEIYLVSKIDWTNFNYTWPNYSGLFLSTTIDYLIDGPKLSKQFLDRLYSGPNVGMMVDKGSYPGFNLVFKPYFEDGVEENTLSFYDNRDYFSVLSCTPIQLINEISKKPLSEIAPAYIFDLEYQYNHGLSKTKYNEMKLSFDKEFRRVSVYRKYSQGFLIPQVNHSRNK